MGDVVLASLFVAAAAGMLALRRYVRRELVLGFEAAVLAGVGVTIAARSTSVVVIAAACALGFAAVVQQYAALVYAHLERGHLRRHDDASIVLVGLLGFAAYLVTDRAAVLVAIACWATAEAAWMSIVRGLSIWRREVLRHQVLPPLYGRARWRRLGDGLAQSRDPAFWGLVVARPIARVVLQLVVEWRALTPNRITAASVVAAFAAAAILGAGGHVAIAIVLIGARSILDSMDGQLARYRACGSSLGSYVDKVSDLFCWGALFAGFAIRAYRAAPEPMMLLLPLCAAITLALLGVALWLARALVAQAAAAPPVQLGVAAWAKSLWRIVLFEEPDFYLWIALGAATARYDVFVPLIAGAYAARVIVMIALRINFARSALKETLA